MYILYILNIYISLHIYIIHICISIYPPHTDRSSPRDCKSKPKWPRRLWSTPPFASMKEETCGFTWKVGENAEVAGISTIEAIIRANYYTLQGTNISHLGKRKIIFKMTFLGDMLVPWRVFPKPDFFNMFWHLGKDILGIGKQMMLTLQVTEDEHWSFKPNSFSQQSLEP